LAHNLHRNLIARYLQFPCLLISSFRNCKYFCLTVLFFL
jgi:hypothetical protein